MNEDIWKALMSDGDAKVRWFNVLWGANVQWSSEILFVLKEKSNIYDVMLCRRQNICFVHLPLSHWKQIKNIEIGNESLLGVNKFCTITNLVLTTELWRSTTTHRILQQTIGLWHYYQTLESGWTLESYICNYWKIDMLT